MYYYKMEVAVLIQLPFYVYYHLCPIRIQNSSLKYLKFSLLQYLLKRTDLNSFFQQSIIRLLCTTSICFCPNCSFFNRIVLKYEGDKYVKHFTCWNQLLTMMFG